MCAYHSCAHTRAPQEHQRRYARPVVCITSPTFVKPTRHMADRLEVTVMDHDVQADCASSEGDSTEPYESDGDGSPKRRRKEGAGVDLVNEGVADENPPSTPCAAPSSA
jgi:hypothetical protein